MHVWVRSTSFAERGSPNLERWNAPQRYRAPRRLLVLTFVRVDFGVQWQLDHPELDLAVERQSTLLVLYWIYFCVSVLWPFGTCVQCCQRIRVIVIRVRMIQCMMIRCSSTEKICCVSSSCPCASFWKQWTMCSRNPNQYRPSFCYCCYGRLISCDASCEIRMPRCRWNVSKRNQPLLRVVLDVVHLKKKTFR